MFFNVTLHRGGNRLMLMDSDALPTLQKKIKLGGADPIEEISISDLPSPTGLGPLSVSD